MGNCCSKPSGSPVILSPPHDGSNPSLPPPVESYPLCARDSGSPPPPPPPMEASLPPPVPSGLPSPFMDSIEDLKGMCDKIDLVGQIDLLISFIENQILNMKTPSGARPSSSEGWLGTILDGTKLAAKTVDFISTEAERLSESDVVKGLGNLTLNVMKGIGQLHWVFVGLSVAAFAVESHMKIGSTQNECNDLLLKILELAKTVGKFKQVMPDELETREKMCNAVATIVEGAVICVAYLKKGYLSRFLSTSTAAAQLDKANKQLNDARDSLGLAATFQILRQATRLPDQSSVSPLLEIQPVGIEEQVKEVKALLDMEGVEPALAVIVCGFGGLGKSTLAASVVDSLDLSSTEFNFCRVAINESTPDKTSHIIHLQKFIINKLEGVKYDFQSPEEGRHRIKEAVKNKCSLLFIDNVVDKDYVRDLLPRDWSSSEEKTKLRILITSREKNVKAELKINCKEYDVKALSEEASKHLLFETIVEDNVEEDRDFDERGMINQVAAACKGVPILLSVFGKHLRVARNEDNYQEELNEALKVLREGNLNTFREEYLGSKLMFVYDKIQDVEVKEAFLDICSYFQGWKWSIVADIVDILKLEDLRKRMLVSKSDSGEVIVHDILQLMGMKEARLTRFSNYKELSDNLDGSEKVKGISLVNDNSLIIIQSTQLDDMAQSLRVLMLGDWVKIDGTPSHKIFTNLRYLRVGDINAFPFKDPSKLNELRVFVNRSKCGMNLSHLPSSLRRISHEVPHADCDKFAKLPFENLRFLKSFTVKTRNSVELPEELHLPASLVDLDLSRCKNLPKDIGHLTALQSLILDRTDMQCLLQGFGKLQKLQHLSMDYCSKLAFLSEEFGMLSSLKALSMEECVNLTALPDRLEGLHSLQTLELTGSINLELLPESFGELRLRSLKLERLEKLKELPNSFGNMALLENLSLTSCKSLMSLPSSFVQLKMLQTLELEGCTKLSALPEYFGRLRYLKRMTVSYCTDLKELPYGFGALPDLKDFSLHSGYSFVNLPKDFTELTSLEDLSLSDLPLISRFPDGFGKLKNLRFLKVKRCFQLKTLSDDFDNLATLEQLAIQVCPELDGAMMEKILKLQQCYLADILGSSELLKKWKHMKSETEYPVEVRESYLKADYDVGRERAIRVGLLQGKCMEVNNTTHQLMERPSLLAVFEKGTKVTVALIMLPIHFQFQSHHQQTLRRFVDMARETATSNGSDKLQIVCARQCLLGSGKRPTPTEAEEEDKVIPQILLSLPEGSCAIPSSESKRLNLLSYCLEIRYNANLVFFMANKGLDIDGRKTFENLKFIQQEEISGNLVMEPAPSVIRKPQGNTILNFIKSIHPATQVIAEQMGILNLKMLREKVRRGNS